VEQEQALVWLDSGAVFEPVLRQCQGEGQGRTSVRIPQFSHAMCKQRRIRREQDRRASNITQKMNNACRKRAGVASAEKK